MTTIGKDISVAKRLLENGEAVAIPTETVYGLGANALNPEAVLKIFEAKNRPQFNPLIVHTHSWEAAMNYVQNVPAIAHHLAKKFTPGPLTFLLEKKEIVPDLVTAGSDLVAVRIPDHSLTLELLSILDFPLAAPSANQFGYISPTTAAHVLNSLEGKIEYILDGGQTTVGLESTIIGFNESGNIIVYRVGGITVEALEKEIGERVNFAQQNPHKNPQTAGQLKSHYAPETALYIGDITELAQKYAGRKMAIMSFSHDYKNLEADHHFILSKDADLSEAATNLFATLRKIDQLDLEIIVAEYMPDEGLGKAINDRLKRAQALYKQ